MRVNLGDRVKDRISGLQGIAIARTEWLYGCVRVTIQPEKLDKDGKQRDNVTVDEPQCEVLKVGVIENRPHWRDEIAVAPRRAAGPRPDAVRQQDPSR
jgi:hypothetical protein